ncbi:MAG: hypothetical protein WC140_06415 [Bacteroidales bacterium]
MKKITTILIIMATIVFTTSKSINAASRRGDVINKTDIQLTKGNIKVFDYGTYKVHIYSTKDLMNDVCIIIEKKNKAILIESPAFKDNFEEFRNYITKNNINLEALILPYHPLGGSFIDTDELRDIDIYTTIHVINYFNKGFGSVMKAGIPKTFGDKIDSKLYTANKILPEGICKIAGIKMNLVRTYDGFDIEIPAIKTVYVHILGHNVHSEILSAEHLDNSIKNFQNYLNEGYIHFLSSHYATETKENMQTKLNYLITLKRIISNSNNREEFVNKMKEIYPSYKEGYLQTTAGTFFSNK